MAYGTPADPVGGTVITVAYAVANLLNPIRWLRLMTGNADPPGSSYVILSSSTSATAWSKIPADALAGGAVVTHLGYTPVNRAGDTGMTGDFTTTGAVSAQGLVAGVNGVYGGSGGFNATGPYVGGTTLAGASNLQVIGLQAGANGVHGGTGGFNASGPYIGGSKTLGTAVLFKGVLVGADGIAIDGPVASLSGVSGTTGTFSAALSALSAAITNAITAASATISGLLTVGSITGGSPSTGTLSVKGLVVGSDGASIGAGGVATTGAVNPASYAGGSSVLGGPAFLGATIGANGLAIAGQIASAVAPGTPPFIIASDTQVANLNAFMVQGIQPTATPTGTRIPISDSSGLLDAWVSPSAGAVPAGMGCLWSNTIASIPAGWSRWTAMNGRIPVGAGTTFSTTFVEGTSYGTSWSHTHTETSHAHGASSLGVSGNTGTNSAVGSRGGTGTNTADSPHTHDQGTLDVTGSTDSATPTITTDAWVIPMFAVVAVTKN